MRLHVITVAFFGFLTWVWEVPVKAGVLLPRNDGIVVGKIKADGENYLVQRREGSLIVPKKDVFFVSTQGEDDPIMTALRLIEDGFDPIGREILYRAARSDTPWKERALRELKNLYSEKKAAEQQEEEESQERLKTLETAVVLLPMPERPPVIPFTMERWQWKDRAFCQSLIELKGLLDTPVLDSSVRKVEEESSEILYRVWKGLYHLPNSEFNLTAVQWTFERNANGVARLIDVDFQVSYIEVGETTDTDEKVKTDR